LNGKEIEFETLWDDSNSFMMGFRLIRLDFDGEKRKILVCEDCYFSLVNQDEGRVGIGEDWAVRKVLQMLNSMLFLFFIPLNSLVKSRHGHLRACDDVMITLTRSNFLLVLF